MPHRHHRQPRRRPWPGLRLHHLHHLRPGRPVPGVDRPDARNVLRGLR